MKLKHIIAAIFLMLSFAARVAADPLTDAYQRGEYATVLQIIRPLAEQGDTNAQYNIGIMYREGQGVPQDYAEAVKWYRLAADQGDAEAQLNLGTRYAQGQGVPQDYVLAHVWFNLSAAQGNQVAVKNRVRVTQHMNPAQIAEAQKLAREWKPTKQQPRKAPPR
jgi:TPR repeat protein